MTGFICRMVGYDWVRNVLRGERNPPLYEVIVGEAMMANRGVERGQAK